MNPETIDPLVCCRDICRLMLSGLTQKQDSVPMLPAYLKADRAVPLDTPVAVIDAGGTNFRTALLRFTSDGAVLESLQTHPMPGAAEEATWADFISYTADCLEPLLDFTDRIGFCFSYPGEVTPQLDSQVLSLTKQLKLKGADGAYPGADLRAELAKRGKSISKVVVLNDTPAALLGAYALTDREKFGGYLGLVAGTGVNTCGIFSAESIEKIELSEGRILINCETGSYAGFTRGDFDFLLDKNLPDTGKYTAEKMTGGAYLGEVCRYTLKGAACKGLFSKECADFIGTLDKLETSTADSWLEGNVPPCFKGDDKDILVYIISKLFERAARCLCSTLCGLILATDEGINAPVCIGVDGSLFKKSKFFHDELIKNMDACAGTALGRKFEFFTADEMSLMGTATAALTN